MNRGGRIREVLMRPAPCDTCRHVSKCKSEELACCSFWGYVNNTGGWYGKPLEREPSKAWYARVFEEEK